MTIDSPSRSESVAEASVPEEEHFYTADQSTAESMPSIVNAEVPVVDGAFPTSIPIFDADRVVIGSK